MNTPCIEWRGRKNAKGYGTVLINGKQFFVHRLAVALSGRNIPKSKVCDHLCRNHSCYNPEHIELVTIVENARRGVSLIAHMGERSNCKNGHPFTEENTRWFKPKDGRNPQRHCRRCYADREFARRRRINKVKGKNKMPRFKYGN